MHKLNAKPGQSLYAAGSARRIAALVGCGPLMLATGVSTEVAADASFLNRLQPATDESLVMVVPARRVQVYECRATKDTGYGWTFVAPDAQLFDPDGRTIGLHNAARCDSLAAADGDRGRPAGRLQRRVEHPPR